MLRTPYNRGEHDRGAGGGSLGGGGDLSNLIPLVAKPQSLTEMVYDAIRGSIVSKRLQPGTVVAEASLAARLHVSKTPVREALLRLQSIGLVEADGARGLRVVLPSEAAIRQAYEVRTVLEEGLARRAAERARGSEREKISAAARQSLEAAEAGDIRSGFKSWDKTFHRAVAAAAGNAQLARLSEDASALATVLRERDVPEIHDAIRCGHQHLAIASAIARSDLKGAGAAAAEHVSDVKQMVLTAFREQHSEPAAVGGGR